MGLLKVSQRGLGKKSGMQQWDFRVNRPDDSKHRGCRGVSFSDLVRF